MSITKPRLVFAVECTIGRYPPSGKFRVFLLGKPNTSSNSTKLNLANYIEKKGSHTWTEGKRRVQW
jgi:hypothetical protein